MKTIVQYIKEASVTQYRLNSVIAPYDVEPQEIVLQAPETFQESDVQQYINDRWLNALPSSQDYAEKFFGKNNDNIIDARFEYDTFEHIDLEPKEYIEWDSKYDVKKSNDDIKLDYFRIKNLRYIIEFDRFDMIDVDDDTVEEKLIDIFRAAESNNENDQYPIEIIFDADNLKFRK